MAGHSQSLNRREMESLVVRLSQERQMGLAMIVSHTGFSRTQVAAILASRRSKGKRR